MLDCSDKPPRAALVEAAAVGPTPDFNGKDIPMGHRDTRLGLGFPLGWRRLLVAPQLWVHRLSCGALGVEDILRNPTGNPFGGSH